MSKNCVEIYVHVYILQVMKSQSQLINYKKSVRISVVITHLRVPVHLLIKTQPL